MKQLLRVAAVAVALVLSACSVYSGSVTSDVVERALDASVLVERVGESGHGSGTIIQSDGVILTAAHIVGDARDFVVTLSDGRKFPGTIMMKSIVSDLAVIGIEATGLPFAKIGEPAQIGQSILVVGNPFNMLGSVSLGHVALTDYEAKGRPHVLIHSVVLPGNSGGGMFSLDGRLIGVITMTRLVPANFMNASITTLYPIGIAEPIEEIKEFLTTVDELWR